MADQETESMMALEVQDGGDTLRFCEGVSFGAHRSVAGELVFQTGMVGYPESITDPSYRGQILVITFPLVGNYGVPPREDRDAVLEDLPAHFEAAEIHIAGLVVASYAGEDYSHHLASSSLGTWLKEQNVPAVCGVDTRALTKRIRDNGSMLGRLLMQTGTEQVAVPNGLPGALTPANGTLTPARTPEEPNLHLVNGRLAINGVNGTDGHSQERKMEEVATYEEIEWYNPNTRNLVADVSTPKPKTYCPSASVALKHPSGRPVRVVCVDVGLKYNQLRCLVNRGVEVKVVPWDYDFPKLAGKEYDGLFISNGPGDPAMMADTVQHITTAMQEARTPIFGICLGHQLLARAAGADTLKMKFGNRGHNIPCTNLLSGKCYITSQNHGYAVDADTLPKQWTELFVNANDHSNEGIRHVSRPYFSVQFHPESAPGPRDTEFLFDVFIQTIMKAIDDPKTMEQPVSFPGGDAAENAAKHPKLSPKKVLVLGSGGLSIGQAGEFDYSGSQAIKALKEEGIYTILINPNIATIQTSKGLADKVYFLPVNAEFVRKVIKQERPDAIYVTFGGQTALQVGIQLKDEFEELGVQVLGTQIDTIITTEDRELFARSMESIGAPCAKSKSASNIDECLVAVEEIGYPVIIRAAYALGGLGSGFAENKEQLLEICNIAFAASPQVLIERSMKGWKEIEYEVVRDAHDNCITVCNMENFDPLGIHTGDSVVVAPSQTLSDEDYNMLRSTAVKVIRHLGVVGECNIQYALNRESREYCIIEVNARLSRSSALASKATGYPLAFIAAKLGLNVPLNEIKNTVTKKTVACFEPSLDYVVVKIPRWDLKKFTRVSTLLGSSMKSVGEVMAIGRTFEEAIQKAIRSVDPGNLGFNETAALMSIDIDTELQTPSDQRMFALANAMHHGYSAEKIWQMTKIDQWFLKKLKGLSDFGKQMTELMKECNVDTVPVKTFRRAKELGFSDRQLALFWDSNEQHVRRVRIEAGITPVVKQIDTVAAEFPAYTNYLYTTYNGTEHDVSFEDRGVMVLGSGVYRIGSSVEFDWCSVRAVRTLRENGMKTVMINHSGLLRLRSTTLGIMTFTASTILELVCLVAWAVLTNTHVHQKSPLYATFFTSLAALELIASTASLSFAPGLLDVLQSATPPTIQFFKSLPKCKSPKTKWAVYLLVLEKPGCRPKIYIGSATETENGVHHRFQQYDVKRVLPRWVAHALDTGYTITHKVPLCWMSIPRAAHVPINRLLFVFLEATFSYMFWAMRAHATRDYGMSDICFWDRDALEYDGLCSHCALYEGPKGDFDLSPEELEAKNAVHEAKRLKEGAERSTKSRASNPEQARLTELARVDSHVAEKLHHCERCNLSFQRSNVLEDHYKTEKHKRKATEATNKFRCACCNLGFANQQNLTRHNKTKYHLANAKGDAPFQQRSSDHRGVHSTKHFDEADRLYFENLDLESVLNIYELERASGVIVAVGGQTPNNIALPLYRANVKIFGTSPEMIDKAENRYKFSRMLDRLGVDQPQWKELTSIEEARIFCRKVNYPVLVRPSYVLSGAAMNIVYSEHDLAAYLAQAVEVSRDYPVVVTKYIEDAKEIEMDAVARNGIMIGHFISEHVENAGVHSGDATLVLPPQDIDSDTIRKIEDATRKIGDALNVTGPYNIQFIAKDNEIKVIECNVRASRSFPFVSKVMGVDLIEMATKAMTGIPLREYPPIHIPADYVAVKVPQFSFSRLSGADPVVGVEMASTGEVACFGRTKYEAYIKGLISTGFKLPKKNILLSIGSFKDKMEMLPSVEKLRNMGYKIYATAGTADFMEEHGINVQFLEALQDDQQRQEYSLTHALANNLIDLYINLPSSNKFRRPANYMSKGYRTRRMAVDYQTPLVTNVKIAKILIEAISRNYDMNISKVDYMTFADAPTVPTTRTPQPEEPSRTLTDLLKLSPLKGKDVISVKHFTKEDLHILFTVATEMRLGVEREGCLDILRGKVLCLMFFEPSTRTSSSFDTAMKRLGGQCVMINESHSSTQKGESLSDTIRTLDMYGDAIVLRHPDNDSADVAAKAAANPVINAGNGSREHPTQAFLDLFTIREELGTVNGLTITFTGDLRYGRTVHSLCELLRHYNVTIQLAAPAALSLPSKVRAALKERGQLSIESERLTPEMVAKTDVLYCTRVQKERFEDPNMYDAVKDELVVNSKTLRDAKKNMIVMHPLPRNLELHKDVDDDPRAAYFRQMRYGMFVRMALLALVMG
ncbi:hypothetical protein LTR08_003160 [Meristemomyces frigidus]|nr:hypothetical protein LTR08_003160 [Meristemomyces frigidus]